MNILLRTYIRWTLFILQTEAVGAGQLVEAAGVGEVVEAVAAVVLEDRSETGTKESTNRIELWRRRVVNEPFFVYKLNCRKTYVSVVWVDVFVVSLPPCGGTVISLAFCILFISVWMCCRPTWQAYNWLFFYSPLLWSCPITTTFFVLQHRSRNWHAQDKSHLIITTWFVFE